MSENISMSDIIPASVERVYAAWLDAKQHGAMTGSSATDEGGGRFTAWDGYITGRTVSAVPHEKIVQAWRTTEFPEDAPDSMLTITFTAAEGGATKVSLLHESIPDGQGASYRKGWNEFYFTPMNRYFAAQAPLAKAKASVEHALEEAREVAEEVAEETVKRVKKARKTAAATLKKVGQQVQALLARGKKKAAPRKPAKKATPKKSSAKKAAPKKKKPAAKKKTAAKSRRR